MLTEILRHIRNYFPVTDKAVSNTFTIEEGSIALLNVKNGQYFLIEGSVFNDGVHRYPATNLKNETFNGVITPLAIPSDFLSLVEEITEYEAKYGDTTPFTSESFGGYSYTKATGANGGAISWRDAFRTRLNTWRKL